MMSYGIAYVYSAWDSLDLLLLYIELSLIIMENVNHSIFLCSILSLICFWNSDYKCIRLLDIVTQVTKVCSFSIFFSLFNLDNFLLYILEFTISLH